MPQKAIITTCPSTQISPPADFGTSQVKVQQPVPSSATDNHRQMRSEWHAIGVGAINVAPCSRDVKRQRTIGRFKVFRQIHAAELNRSFNVPAAPPHQCKSVSNATTVIAGSDRLAPTTALQSRA